MQFLFLIIITSFAYTKNPGIMFAINTDAFNQLKLRLLPYLNDEIKAISIDSKIETKELTVTDIKVSINPIKPRLIDIQSSERNYFRLKISEIRFTVSNDVDLHCNWLKTSGSITTNGRITDIMSKVTFENFKPDDPKPYIKVKIQEYTYDSDDMKYTASFKYVPDFVTKMIISYFKENILEIVANAVLNTLNDNGSKIVNSLIKDYYPLDVDIGYSTALSIQLVNQAYISNGYAIAEIDGTFFDKSRKYSKFENSEKLEYSNYKKYSGYVYATEYSINTLVDALYNKKIDIKWNNIQFNFTIINPQQSVSLNSGKLWLKDFKLQINIKYKDFIVVVNTSLTSIITFKTVGFIDKSIQLSIEYLNFEQFTIDSSFPYFNFTSIPFKMIITLALMKYNAFNIQLNKFGLIWDFSATKPNIIPYDRGVGLGMDIVSNFNFKKMKPSSFVIK